MLRALNAVLVFIFGLTGCFYKQSMTGVEHIDFTGETYVRVNPRHFSPPEHYSFLWQFVNACGDDNSLFNPEADYGKLTWVKVDRLIHYSGRYALYGMFIPVSLEIVIRQDVVGGYWVPGHEMMHYILPGLSHSDPAWIACEDFLRSFERTDPLRVF